MIVFFVKIYDIFPKSFQNLLQFRILYFVLFKLSDSLKLSDSKLNDLNLIQNSGDNGWKNSQNQSESRNNKQRNFIRIV